MIATVQRKLTVTAGTSGLAEGARSIQGFGRVVDGSVDRLKRGIGPTNSRTQEIVASFAEQSS